jgi:hypothetical protein
VRVLKKALAIITIPLILTLVFALLSMNNFTLIKVAYANPADSYGDDILYIEVWEDTTLKANFTSSGGSVRVNASKTITFNVSICFNSTLASSTSEAVSYTAVYANITGIWTNVELNNTSVILNGSFYYLIEQGILAANTLSEGTTYECTFLYKGYY